MKSLFEQYRDEFQSTTYCCYCLQPQGDKYHCCQENHFVPFEDLYLDEQKSIIEEEMHWAEIEAKQQEILNGR